MALLRLEEQGRHLKVSSIPMEGSADKGHAAGLRARPAARGQRQPGRRAVQSPTCIKILL